MRLLNHSPKSYILELGATLLASHCSRALLPYQHRIQEPSQLTRLSGQLMRGWINKVLITEISIQRVVVEDASS